MDAISWVQLLISGIAVGSVYALVGFGFTTIYQTSRVVNFAQGSFVMLSSIFAYSSISHRCLVLQNGNVVFRGALAELGQDDLLRRLYLC